MAYSEEVKERGFVLYEKLGSLREAHRALQEELHQKDTNAPAWRTFVDWSKQGHWVERRDTLAEKLEEATNETLVEWRHRRLQQIENILDYYLDRPEEIPAHQVTKLFEIAERLQGGGKDIPEDGDSVSLTIDLSAADEDGLEEA